MRVHFCQSEHTESSIKRNTLKKKKKQTNKQISNIEGVWFVFLNNNFQFK